MDHSNPVVDASRKKIKDMVTDVADRRRQDLEYLKTIVSGSSRVFLPSLPRRKAGEGVQEEELAAFLREQPQVTPAPVVPETLDFLEHQEPMPTSGLMLEGVPLHPPGVHQAGGNVTTARQFGGSRVDAEWLRRLLEYRARDDFVDNIKSVYTRGTACGFVNRLKILCTNNPPKITHSFMTNRAGIIARLERLLPIKPETLMSRSVTWHADLLDQLDEITTSAVSSAGPPYWVKKPAALQKLTSVVFPLLHKAISEGTVDKLFREQPELFVGEVKNKLDRYEIAKLGDKTRPYFALPFHFQALFSMMSQPFTEALELFHEGSGSNAYGHAWAHGGCEKLREWAMEAIDLKKRGGRPRFCAYGDDVDVYYRKDGVLWRIAPDFRQMDSSIDNETVYAVVDYVVQSLEKVWGENPFFKEVARYWKMWATDPLFLVHGETVFKKKQKQGLMTGVVGTTLFDTAKAVLAYDAWADEIEYGNRALLEAGPAKEWFKMKFGLNVKEGTWKPEIVHEEPTPGNLWSENKFLGVYLVYQQGPQKAQLVPYLYDEDWVDLLLSPRDDPFDFKFNRPKASQIVTARRWFDRIRGYMITGAFSHEIIRKWLQGIVNDMDAVPIVMSVQGGNGKGETPAVTGFFGKEDENFFEYPDSSGFPSYEWCQNLYFTKDNQWQNAEWLQLFPDVTERLNNFRANHRQLIPKMAVLEMADKNPDKTSSKIEMAQQVISWEPPDPLEDLETPVEHLEPISAQKSEKLDYKTINKRSKILDYTKSHSTPTEKKYMPSSRDVIWKKFESVATPPILPKYPGTERERVSQGWVDLVSEVEEKRLPKSVWKTPVLSLNYLSWSTGYSKESVEQICREIGLYVIGKPHQKYVTKVPLLTGDPTLSAQQLKQKEETFHKLGKVTPNTTKQIAVVRRAPAHTPEYSITVLGGKIPELKTHRWKKDRNPIVSLNSLFQVNSLVPKLYSVNRQTEEGQVCETKLGYRSANEKGYSDLLMATGKSSKENVRAIYLYLCAQLGLDVRPETLQEKQETDWNKIVENEERAKLWTSSGVSFSVVGRDLTATSEGEEWCEIMPNRRVKLGGVEWKQRKNETLTGFLKRTVSKIEELGQNLTVKTLTKTPKLTLRKALV